MAFPTVRSAFAGTQGTNATSWTLTLPDATHNDVDDASGYVQNGDLILINIGRDGASGTGAITGYDLIFNAAAPSSAARGLTFARIASSETPGGTFSFAPGASEQGAWRIVVIRDWYGSGHADGTGVAVSSSTGNTGTSANPDPDQVTPGWGSADNYYRAVCAWDDGRPNATSFPTNFTTNPNSDASGGSGGAGLGGGTRTNTSSSENPGTFTLTGTGSSTEWVAWTIAVRPAAPVVVVPRRIRESLQAVHRGSSW